MEAITYFITDAVFVQFPDYVRGVVIAEDVVNGASPPELVALLRETEVAARERLVLETLAAEPHMAVWREVFRKIGIKPSEFRPSIEALARRVLHGQELPLINMLVDIGTLISLRHLVPTGGHAIDHLTQDIALRTATGEETFVPFGSDQVEHPAPDEIIFAEGDTVLTRRWIWRQANHTLTLPTTTAIEFNVDGLPPAGKAEIEQICQEVMDLTARFCGGTLRYELLTRENPRILLKR